MSQSGRERDVDTRAAALRTARASQSARGIRITAVGGPDAGTTRTVAQRHAVLGRSPAADVPLADPMVSSFHVELSACDEGLRVVDLNSRNGTFHAGARLLTAIVPSGAILELGGTQVRVDLDTEFAPDSLDAASFGELRGTTPVMRELFAALAKLARTDLALLIEGPTGTGKELAARAVHAHSTRANGPFVVLDCAAIPAGIAESVLFGHEKGAFTGAVDAHAGVFESADGGTVFLDEIGELPTEMQPKLLRVLERREVVRVGGRTVRPVRVRTVCATWRDLRGLINQGRFREDLYYRLVQARVAIPPLRERTDDIAMLVWHFLKSRPADMPGARGIAPDAFTEICAREYPGNVRELKSVIERAAAMADGAVITAADLAVERMLVGECRRAPEFREPQSLRPTRAPEGHVDDGGELAPFKEAKRSVIDEFERAYLERLLARAEGKVTRAAQLAGLERHNMRELLRRHGL